jgi:hypothetical protein
LPIIPASCRYRASAGAALTYLVRAAASPVLTFWSGAGVLCGMPSVWPCLNHFAQVAACGDLPSGDFCPKWPEKGMRLRRHLADWEQGLLPGRCRHKSGSRFREAAPGRADCLDEAESFRCRRTPGREPLRGRRWRCTRVTSFTTILPCQLRHRTDRLMRLV